MKIGLIQAGGIGDIIIALPIADFFLERGFRIHWPVEDCHYAAFSLAKPEVNFVPIKRDDGLPYDTPLKCLKELGCERIISLPSYLPNRAVVDEKLSRSLKFDEYKYAVAGVPFARKWDLRIKRDLDREAALLKRLNITRSYICVHQHGSKVNLNIRLPQDWIDQFQIIDITPLTDSPFDWLSALEGASKLVMIDSCFANLVEQLNIPVEKYFIFCKLVQFTPVMKNGWKFLT